MVVTHFSGTTSPSDSLFAPRPFSLAFRAGGSPVLRTSPCSRAAPNTPVDPPGSVDFLLPAASAFSLVQQDRHPHRYFRGLLRLHSDCCPLACSPSFPRTSVSGLHAGSHPPPRVPDSYRGASTTPRAGLPPAGDVRLHGARRVGVRRGAFFGLFLPWPVSSRRSSNRTCGFPGSGFRMVFTREHARVGAPALTRRRTFRARRRSYREPFYSSPCDASSGSF